MASYKQLQREPASRDLFNNRITTLQGLSHVVKDSAFIAIDTEHVARTSEKDRILHQVGLAYLQTLVPQNHPETNVPSADTRQPDRQGFYTENNIDALTLDITLSQETQNELIGLRGPRGIPARHSHRFGQEQQVDHDTLEGAVTSFLQRHNNKTSLVLIGFEMAAEWTYLSAAFPQAMSFFSAWVDLRDIAKDITFSVGVIPGLVSLLQLLDIPGKIFNLAGSLQTPVLLIMPEMMP